jgi:putative membrane protein
MNWSASMCRYCTNHEEKSMKMRIGMRCAAAGLSLVLGIGTAVAQDTTSDDKKFLKEAAEGNLVEINLAKLALEKSGDANVKKFAQKMIKDHEMLIVSMKPLNRKLGVKEPSGPPLTARAKYEELKLKSGISFDRAYVEAMVKDHNDDLKAFIDEENKTTNPEVKAAVAKGEAVVREHTEMIDGIARQGGIDVPPMPGA